MLEHGSTQWLLLCLSHLTDYYFIYKINTELKYCIRRRRWQPLLNGTMSLWTSTGSLVLCVIRIPGENSGVIIFLRWHVVHEENNINQVNCHYEFDTKLLAYFSTENFFFCLCFLLRAECVKNLPLQSLTHGQMTSPSGRWGDTATNSELHF